MAALVCIVYLSPLSNWSYESHVYVPTSSAACVSSHLYIYIWKKKKGTEKITYSTHSTYFPNGSSIHPLGSNWVQTVAAPLLGGANERTRKKK